MRTDIHRPAALIAVVLTLIGAPAHAATETATGMDPVSLFAVIAVLGIGAQWLAWRLQMPGIVLMLAAGVIAGPVTGLIDPQAAFGDLLRPLVAVAVAVILFEGGLTLNIADLRQTGVAVRRLVLLGAPLGWLLSTLAVRFGGGLSWESSAVFGGILVVTGPTVVIPLLRQARLKSHPAALLRWEAILNDAVGALCAVLAFEVITALYGATTLARATEHFALGLTAAVLAGFAAGRGVTFAFKGGHVPEFLKVPVLLGAVLVVYASTDSLLHESGLLAVTVMGVVLGNAKLASFDELRRFKEQATVILVSGVFILLAASLDTALLGQLSWRAGLLIFLVVLVVRPLTVAVVLAGTGVPLREQAMVAWIAPRGIVAVAVAGLFGTRLADLGVPDGALLAPLAFAIVAATVVLSGFTIRPAARALGLVSTDVPGVLLVGGNAWTVALARTLQDAGTPVLMSDRNWHRLAPARKAGVPVYHGEILSEAAEHHLDLNAFEVLIAGSDNAAYNTLVCTDFAPEFGRGNVYQPITDSGGERGLPVTLGGRWLGKDLGHGALMAQVADGPGFTFEAVTKGADGTLPDWPARQAEHPAARPFAVRKASGALQIIGTRPLPRLVVGDAVLWLGPMRPDAGSDAKNDAENDAGPDPEAAPA